MKMAIRFKELTLVCPNCEHKFGTRGVLGAAPVRQRTTDFHDRYNTGESLLPHLIHLCDRCGFCGTEDQYAETGDVGFKLARQHFIAERLSPNLPWVREYLVDRYEHALQVLQFGEHTPVGIADLALRGAWAAVEERDRESERYFRRIAVDNYILALQHFDMIDPAMRAQITYLIGELWRRLGEDALASQWYDSVENAVLDINDQQWVVSLAAQQRKNPQEYL